MASPSKNSYILPTTQPPSPTNTSYSTSIPSPSSDETANWKTVTLEKLNLSLKIPPEYQSGYLGSSSEFAIDLNLFLITTRLVTLHQPLEYKL